MLKIMTFNLRGCLFEIDGANYWPHRAVLNRRTIARYAPDIIGFQEFQSDHEPYYAVYLAEYAYDLGLYNIDQSEFGMRNPIYWREARLKLEDKGAFYLSQTPDEWSVGWDSHFVRSATWVKLRDRLNGESFVVLNAHLDHLGEGARVGGAELITAQLESIADGLPVVVTGDFNSRVWALEEHGGTFPPEKAEEATPPGTVHRVFLRGGYRDTYVEAGHVEGTHTNTFHNFEGESYYPIGQRIDWVLLRSGARAGWRTLACDIIRDAEPPLYPSDHYPVMATCELVKSWS